MAIKTTNKVVVEKIVDVFVCEVCSKKHPTEEKAEECEKNCKIALEKRKKKEELEEQKYCKRVDKALKAMPKFTDEEYAKMAIEVALVECDDIIPCLGCGHPRMTGRMCINDDCPGEPDDIDTEDLFYDERFELPDDFQVVLDLKP
jgi:hypothetical protein